MNHTNNVIKKIVIDNKWPDFLIYFYFVFSLLLFPLTIYFLISKEYMLILIYFMYYIFHFLTMLYQTKIIYFKDNKLLIPCPKIMYDFGYEPKISYQDIHRIIIIRDLIIIKTKKRNVITYIPFATWMVVTQPQLIEIVKLIKHYNKDIKINWF
mgnify:CR=1 FL=1